MKDSKARPRRTEEERIAELEARIAGLKARAERKKAQRSPILRHASAALRAIDKALGAAEDSATKQALTDCRTGLAAVLALHGGDAQGARGGPAVRARRATGVTAEQVLDQVSKHPGRRGEELAAALGTDTATLRPVMRGLIDAGRVRTTGQRRGMQYHPA